jgi:DNA-directed RNA polymerase specialized sigma24 family protein
LVIGQSDESISIALLIVLERLSPAERSAFLLHDIFGFTFEQTAAATGRTRPATGGGQSVCHRLRRW